MLNPAPIIAAFKPRKSKASLTNMHNSTQTPLNFVPCKISAGRPAKQVSCFLRAIPPIDRKANLSFPSN